MNQKPILGSQINFADSINNDLIFRFVQNEFGGDLLSDMSGYENHGKIYGATWTPYQNGYALLYDGTNDYTNIGHNPVLSGYKTITWSFWTVPKDTSKYQAGFISKYEATSGKRSWAVRQGETNEQIQLIASIDGDTFSVGTSVGYGLTNNVLCHIVVVLEGGIAYFYKNGNFISSTGFISAQDNIFVGTQDVYIGLYGDVWFNGIIDNISIFKRALTSLEIMELYYKPYAMFECLDLLSFLTETTTYFIGGMRNRQQKPILGEKINFAHPLAQGLVACWIMNEGCGNKIYDLSENRNVGTLSNASWTLYENGSALDFNDTNSSVEIEDNDSLDGYTEMSWSFWVIPRDIAEDTAGFITKYDAVNGKRSWAVRQAEAINEIQLFISGDGTTFAHAESSGFNLIDDALTHIVVVKKGAVGYFYKDGQFISSEGGLASVIYAGSEDVAIGRYRAVFFDGLIDNIQIYNRALTPDEAQQLYYEPYAMFEHIVTYLFGEAAPSVNRRRRLLIAGGCR